jgi:hypothetical protein
VVGFSVDCCTAAETCVSTGFPGCHARCTTDADCATGNYCSGTACVPGCQPATSTTADTCGNGLECSPADHLCHCSQCFDENPVFNNVPHVCVSGGGTSNDQCITGCENDLDCLDSTDYCNTSTHLCVHGGCRPSYIEPSTGQVQADDCGAGLACNAVDHLCRCSDCTQLSGPHLCLSGGGTSNDQCVAVGCETDTDCPAADYCNGGTCVLGCRVSTATATDDCGVGLGLACNPANHLCQCSDCTEANPQLTGPHLCLSGGGTSNDQCVAVGCETDTDCLPSEDFCSGGTCVFGCRISSENCGPGLTCIAFSAGVDLCQCFSGPVNLCTENNPQLTGPHLCFSGGGTLHDQCIAVGCETDADCPSGRYCNAGTHSCTPGPSPLTCLADTDCPAADYCKYGSCVSGCRISSENCGPGLTCIASIPGVDICQCFSGSVNLCTENNPQLTGPHLCLSGGNNFSNDQCVAVGCETDTDCDPADYCSGNVCVVGCRLSPDDCPSGTSCDAATHTCL